MPCKCKIHSIYRSGFARKSPPEEKIKRGTSFELRWCTLGRIELCKKCCKNNYEEEKVSLVFSYYKDKEETNSKGRFEVDDSTLERVERVFEDPVRYENENFILKWDMPKYKRCLYLLLESESDLNGWLKSFDNNMSDPKKEATETEDNDENLTFEEKDKVIKHKAQNNNRIQRELTLLKKFRTSQIDVSPLSEDFKDFHSTSSSSFNATNNEDIMVEQTFNRASYLSNHQRISGASFGSVASSNASSRDSAMSCMSTEHEEIN